MGAGNHKVVRGIYRADVIIALLATEPGVFFVVVPSPNMQVSGGSTVNCVLKAVVKKYFASFLSIGAKTAKTVSFTVSLFRWALVRRSEHSAHATSAAWAASL